MTGLNTLTLHDHPLTMSSREIADLTGKEHYHVIRDIKKMLVDLYGQPGDKFEDLLVDDPNLGHLIKSITCEKDGRGYVSLINLDKEHTITLIAGYEVRLRKRIVARWMELEAQVARPAVDPMQVLNDPSAMRGLLLTYTEKVLALEAKVEEQGAQVKKLERLEGASGSMCITDAAKTLGVGRNELIQFMQARRWIYKRPGSKNWVAYDDMRRARYMEHDEHLYMSADGQERVATRALVTAKGLVKLAELLNAPLH